MLAKTRVLSLINNKFELETMIINQNIQKKSQILRFEVKFNIQSVKNWQCRIIDESSVKLLNENVKQVNANPADEFIKVQLGN